MAPSLDSLAWFYRGKAEQAVGPPETLDHKIIYFLLATFTVTGFFAISIQLFSFVLSAHVDSMIVEKMRC